jgi:uncharacterized protein (TIGR03067 family)
VKNQVVYLLLMLLCLLLAPARAEDLGKTAGSLEGTWELTSVVDNGTTAPTDAISGAKVIFSKEGMTLISPDGEDKTEYTIKLDSTKLPKSIDIIPLEGTFKGQTGLGIYETDGEILRICQPHRPSTFRPFKFAAPEGSGLHLMVLKRVKQ